MKKKTIGCAGCELGEEFLDRKAKEDMAMFGWYAHYVPDDDQCPGGINYHTHGLIESYGHKDLQIVFPLDMNMCHSIATEVVDKIKAGAKFVPDTFYDEILGNGYKVQFIEAKECDRDVLRILIPDKDHQYKGNYAKQLL